MALKFAVSRGRATVQDLASAEEALIESIENVSSAAEALYSAGADGAELCQVMDNLSLAMEAINAGGLTPELIATFNSEGELSACCGLENLTVAGLEAMGDAQVSRLENKYVAGLEGKMGEYWAKFVAWLKNMWAKLVNWFKSILVSRARYSKAISAVLQNKNATWEDKEATLIKAEAVTDAISAATDAESYLATNIGKVTTDAGAGELAVDDKIKALDKIGEEKAEAKKMSELGWTKAFADASGKKYITMAANASINKVGTLIDASFKGLINKAGAAGKIENADEAKTAKEKVQKARENLMKCVDLLRNDNRCVMKIGANVLKALKAGYKAK